jgi:hypothetical protein
MDTQKSTQRLCSEIQLFDLCDLDHCKSKQGRFCTNPEALQRFEAIKEEEPEQYLSDELEEDEDSEELGDDDAYSDDYEEDE